MARPLRQDYPGATHHVFVRGVARTDVALDDADYQHELALLARVVSRFEIRCHAWCFLPNHSHLLVTAPHGNLSRAMHWLGTCTAQAFNLRYERAGHLFQGRFGSRLVEDDDYLLELARYVPMNPVRAGLCVAPQDWPWSSYAATVGLRLAPSFLDAGEFISALGSIPAYIAWVEDGLLASSLDDEGRPRPPDRPPLASILHEDSDRAIARAHFRHGYSQLAIAEFLGVGRTQINRRLALHT
jgi:putative transposase